MRAETLTQEVASDFGKLYIHIELNRLAQPVGGWISTPGKEPESQIAKLVADLSAGLNRALKIGAEQ